MCNVITGFDNRIMCDCWNNWNIKNSCKVFIELTKGLRDVKLNASNAESP